MIITDRRNARRIPYRFFVNRVQGGMTTICRGVDLSRGGMCFDNVVSQRSQEGPVSVEFRLPNSDRILVAHGHQVRLKDNRLSVEFTTISKLNQARIDGYISAARIAV